MIKIVFFLMGILMFGCWYLPVVDYALILDYTPQRYLTTKDLYNSDSLNIEVSGIAHFPDRPRSKNLKLFLVGIKLKVRRNLYTDTLIVDINNTDVSALFYNTTLIGNPRVNSKDSIVNRILQIVGSQVFFVEGSTLTEGGVLFQFPHPKKMKDSLKEHKLKLDFKKIITRNEFLELSPIILEFK